MIGALEQREAEGTATGAPPTDRPAQKFTFRTMATGLPTSLLLVCLIGAAIEWEYVVENKGRLWVALLWSAGVAIAIWLAGTNRRATIIFGLRAFLGLLVIGTIAHPSWPAVSLTVVCALTSFFIGRLWTDSSAPAPGEPDIGDPLSQHSPK
jgi:hypothetical protein